MPAETPGEAVELLRTTAEKMGETAFQESAAKVLGGYPLDACAGPRRTDRRGLPGGRRRPADVLELLKDTYDITID